MKFAQGRVISLLIVAFAWLLFIARTVADEHNGAQDVAWARIQDEGVIRIGVDPSIPPFGQDTPQGPIGLDPDVGIALAEQLGVRVEFILLGFDGLYDALLLEEVDMVIAALRPDPMRADVVFYTRPYFDAGQVLVSRGDFADLAALAGHRLAVEFASEGDLYARRIEGIEIIRYFSPEEALQAVENGEAEAALVDGISARLYLYGQWASALHIMGAPLLPDPYVIALRRSDWRLYREVASALATVDESGALAEIIQQWLGLAE